MKKIAQFLPTNQQMSKFLWGGFIVLLVGMPFHAFLTIVLGQAFGNRAIFQAWKEVLILVMALVWVSSMLRQRKILIDRSRTNLIVGALFLVAFIVTLLAQPSWAALIFGIKTDLVPLVLFLIAQSVLHDHDKPPLAKLILVPAGFVVLGGLAQAFVLSPQMMSQLGYNVNTINPVQLVDPAIDAVRLFSTLGGANQLGAYLVLPICLTLAYILRRKQWWLLPLLGGLGWLSLRSYSRSSWIALALAVFITVVISLRGKWRLAFVSLSIVAAVGGGLFIYQVITSPQNTRLQYLLLHGRVNVDKVEGSDAARTKSQQMAIEKLTQNPIGYGLGVVGPASQQAGRSIVTENWYLQIALELGVAGVLLFVAFWLSNIADLFATIRRLGADPLRIALLASVCGLMLSNLFLHTWADSTLVIMTFSLLGFVRRPA